MLQSTLPRRKGAPGRDRDIPPTHEVDVTSRIFPISLRRNLRFRGLAGVAGVVHAVLSTSCGTSDDTPKARDFGGTLGSCSAKTGFFLDDAKKEEALPCTEHTYVARGTSDPGPSLASSLAEGCQGEGGTWTSSACQGFSLACKAQVETIQPRAADITLTRKTSWKAKGAFSLGDPEDRKALCP